MIAGLMDHHRRRLSADFILLILLISAAFEVQGEEKGSTQPPPAEVLRSTPPPPLPESSSGKNSPINGNNPVPVQNGTSKPPLPPLVNSEAPTPPSLSPPPLNRVPGSPPSPSEVHLPPPNKTVSSPPSPKKEPLGTPPPPLEVKVSPPDHKNVSGEPVKPSPLNDPDDNPNCSDSNSTKCFDNNLFACFWKPTKDSKTLFVIVQNEGNTSLHLTVTEPTHNITFELPSEKSMKKIEVSSGTTGSLTISNGTMSCIVVKTPSSSPTISRIPQLPIYHIQMTPIYGAYALFISVLVAGGAWACCKFGRKDRRVDTGVPYQQIELGLQNQSAPVVDVEAAEGWDHWDDDWGDEETSSRPPQNGEPGNASINGHARKTSIKDEWEEWDD